MTILATVLIGLLSSCATTNTTVTSSIITKTHAFTIQNQRLLWINTFNGTTTLTTGSFSGLIPDNIGSLKWKYVLPAYISTGIFSGDYEVIKTDSSYTIIVKNLKVVSQTLMTGSQVHTRDVYDIVTTSNEQFKSEMGFTKSLEILHETFLNKFKTIR